MHPILLPLVTYLPLLGIVLLLLMKGTMPSSDRFARWIALWVSIVVFGLSAVMWAEFDPQQSGYQFAQHYEWLSGFGVSYHTGLDGISLLFVLLTTFITPLSIMASWHTVTQRIKEFMIAMLFLETCLIGLFSAMDLMVFYVFYEATLIPAGLLVGIWGGPKRVFASIQFFLFTFASSLFMLLSLLAIWNMTGTTDIPVLMHTAFSPYMQGWLMLGFIIAFGAKLPLFPLHAWLPDAYTEAPAAATAVISGIMSKTAAYGILRFIIIMLPDASQRYGEIVMILGVIAVIYAGLVAFAQKDMKKLIAYSSFSHMGIIAIGLFSLTPEGIDGAILQMLSHGVVITSLFLALALLSYRTGTLQMQDMGGVASRMPLFSTLLMLFMMANIGLPGTSSFVAEFLVIIGALHVSFWIAILGATSMIIGAVYMLFLYRKVIFDKPALQLGGVIRDSIAQLKDLSGAELAILVPLAVVILWMGLYPSSFTNVFNPEVKSVTRHTAFTQHVTHEKLAAHVFKTPSSDIQLISAQKEAQR